jgi:hypothetical protein
MKDWFREGRAVFQIPLWAAIITVWVLGPLSWITWIVIAIVTFLIAIMGTAGAINLAAAAVDAWSAVCWAGRGIAIPIQKVVDRLGL